MNESSEKLPTPFDYGEVYDLILKDIPYGFDFLHTYKYEMARLFVRRQEH